MLFGVPDVESKWVYTEHMLHDKHLFYRQNKPSCKNCSHGTGQATCLSDRINPSFTCLILFEINYRSVTIDYGKQEYIQYVACLYVSSKNSVNRLT